MTTQTLRRGGLDWNVPQDGKAADAYNVAQTTLALESRRRNRADHGAPLTPYDAARHATRLHVISGRLWRLAEREVNGNYGEAQGRQCSSLQDDAREIAAHYGLECSFGGIVNGGLVIGTPEQLSKVDPERHGHVIRRLGS